ncbi:hypothetical protein JKP88DRAFT_176236 [Tribonema minus]|uniref:RNA polymerase sigma-70 domain-containing protein n=1 Tax=Tribonema minus TaxID=303371 RepID=A0A836CKU0_9STRA|nr:hypothetical protein JKP88DRAFT_176236 [Tribonema minus]
MRVRRIVAFTPVAVAVCLVPTCAVHVHLQIGRPARCHHRASHISVRQRQSSCQGLHAAATAIAGPPPVRRGRKPRSNQQQPHAGTSTRGDSSSGSSGTASFAAAGAVEGPLCMEVRRLAEWFVVRKQLATTLRRAPSRTEWAHSLGVTPDELNSGIEEAQSAQAELFKRHKALVWYMARGFRRCGLAADDLWQEACVGLLRASAVYNSERGAKFSSLAFLHMRRELQLAAANKGMGMRLPYTTATQIQALKRAEAALSVGLGRAPSDAELAAESGIVSRRRVAQLRPFMASSRCLVTYRDDMTGRAAAAVSSGSGVAVGGEAGGGSVAQAAAPVHSEAVVLGPDEVLEADEVQRLMALLSPKERRVLSLRYGLGQASGARSFKDVAGMLGISYARVRQAETSALLKMHAHMEDAAAAAAGNSAHAAAATAALQQRQRRRLVAA